jgi:hypothetical protein
MMLWSRGVVPIRFMLSVPLELYGVISLEEVRVRLAQFVYFHLLQ